MMRKDMFALPNLLCYLRFVLAGVFLYLYMQEAYGYSALVIALGGITDFLDGQIARRYHMITEWGKIIDPLADKVMQLAIAIALTSRYSLMFVLLGLFVMKEAFQGVCCLISLKKGRKLDGALWFGKVSTALFYVVMVLLIAIADLPLWLANGCIWISMLMLAYAFLMYAITFYRMLSK